MLWRTSRQVCLFCSWARHLARLPHLHVADRWPSFPSKGKVDGRKGIRPQKRNAKKCGLLLWDLQSGTKPPSTPYINGNKAKKKKKYSYYTRVFFQSYVTNRLLVCPRTFCTPLVTPLGKKLQPVGSNIYVCLYIYFFSTQRWGVKHTTWSLI